MRAARAGPVLRGQCFVNERNLRGPALVALSGPVKGQCRLVCRVCENCIICTPTNFVSYARKNCVLYARQTCAIYMHFHETGLSWNT